MKRKLEKKNFKFLWVWVVAVILWGSYRLWFQFPEIVEELFFKPIVFVGPVLWYLGQFERINLEKLGLRNITLKKLLVWGVGFGLLLSGENWSVRFFKGRALNSNVLVPSYILFAASISALTAFSEEILYRGFLLERLFKIKHDEIGANLITSFLFAAGHVGNALFSLKYTGYDMFTYLLLIFIVGFAQGLVYMRTRSVIASSVTHFMWNFSNSFWI